jgi:hypothetical protein
MIRISVLGVDETFCAMQGYASAFIINAIRGVTVFTPLHAAICFGGVAFTEKLVYEVSKRVIPGYSASLGPIPIGTKNIVSHGVAIYTTLKIMQLAGLILNIPQAITIAGLTCIGALVLGSLKYYSKTFEERLDEHLSSKDFSNQVFTFKDGNQEYRVRIICNPNRKKVKFTPNGQGSIQCTSAFILACKDKIPETLIENCKSINGSISIFTARMNDRDPIDYTAKPVILVE